MHLFLLGVSHRTAPLALRERLDFSSRDVGAAVEALSARATTSETVVLSTCNRSEIYVVSDQLARAREELIGFFADYHQVPAAQFVPHLFAREDAQAAHHLFRVAAGLDSLVVGEPQVLGQVKEAFSVAADRRCSGTTLNRLFTSSFAVGKRVRTETGLGEGAVSVSFAAVQLARKIFGKLDGRRVLVIGAGEMGQLTARHLRTNGVGDIVVTGRTFARAEEVAATIGGTAVPWSERNTALGRADIVVTATGSPTPLITRDDVAAAMGRQRREPLFMIDIAVPRDVEAGAGDIEQVFLYNVDDLQVIVHENMSRRSSEVQRAEDIVAEEVGRFMAWSRSRATVSTVVALRRRFDAIRRSELQRLDFKLTGLNPTERARVEEVTRLIVEKLLIEPTEQLKALPDEETQVAYTDAVRRLFALRDDREAEAENGRHETESREPGSSDTSSS